MPCKHPCINNIQLMLNVVNIKINIFLNYFYYFKEYHTAIALSCEL